MILQGPGIGLYRALRVRVATEVHVGAAYRVIADDRDQLLQLPHVEIIGAEPARGGDVGGPSVKGELLGVEGHLDSVRLVFRRITEEVIHLRPELLLL
jgi:hypothetical protein